MRIPVLATLLAPLLAGCVVGPDYQQPDIAGSADQWAQPVSTQVVDLEPWRALRDPLLVELIERAIAANTDVHEAEARLREARAMRDAAAGGRSPRAGTNASWAQRSVSENGLVPISRLPGVQRNFSLYDAGFDASWEIDLWGGNKRAVESAAMRMAAADAQRRDVQLRVVAEVEREYAELRGAQAESAIRRSEAEIYGEQAKLLQQLAEAGEVAESDGTDAQVRARQADAALAAAEPRARASANRLAVLTAQPPEALGGKLAPSPIPAPPEQIAAGLRSEMLQRRPDIIAAEALLAAATADIGVEKAKLFPKLSLLGTVGIQDRTGNDLLSDKSSYFSIGPGLSWPIFASGRIKAQVRAATARADAARAAYEKAVLVALADSETAINRYAGAVAAARSLQQASEHSAVSLSLSRARYREGETSKLDLIKADLRDQTVRLANTRARMEALQAHAALIKALGGGWIQQDSGPQ